MILYPAIDLKGGACVRLVRGEMASATVFNDDPAAQAIRHAARGIVALTPAELPVLQAPEPTGMSLPMAG